MASFIKIVGSDIKSQQLKTLLNNIVRFAFQNMINLPDYKDKVQDKTFEMAELIKISKFKKEFVFQLYNQLIRAGKEHYVVVLGSDYIL